MAKDTLGLRMASLVLAVGLVIPVHSWGKGGGDGGTSGSGKTSGGGGGVGEGGGGGGGGGGEGGGGNLGSLKREPIPLPTNLGSFVIDRAAAIRLGKSLFWDQQTGGDGQQACASCHFQAGADVRVVNTLNPGANGVFDTASPGATLTASKFPINNGDVVGSGGELKRTFNALSGVADDCTTVPDGVFNYHGTNVRQVTGRNTPSAVNAIFNYRSFWDGRANNVFNGVNPAGPTDPSAMVLMVSGGTPVPVQVRLANASLASQAVGPPNNGVEMSCSGRVFPQLGRKLLGLTPLGQQKVDKTDSVLGGALSKSPANGLNTTYASMISAAFAPEWWDSGATDGDGYSMMEHNFSLYWGLSIMLYESTLVSNDSRVDRYFDGNRSALTSQELQGMDVFHGKGHCDHCHSGATTTNATVAAAGTNPLAGFFNDGVRPIADDGGDILQPGKGFFKTPTIRNTELNGPYFHNGDKSTLRQVVEFYNRGGDNRDALTSGEVKPLGLSESDKNALVAFMVALTDDRVRYEKAPFDHPSLTIPNGPSLPAVGAGGRSSAVQRFLGLSPFQP